nr:hypothetical protein [Tanacetum cinerariifolium]
LSPVLEEEPVKKPKRAKKPAKKSIIMPTAGVVLRDIPALLEAAQLKKTIKKSKQKTHKLHASCSSDGDGFQLKVFDEKQDKTTGINEGTDENPNPNQNDDDKKECEEEEYVRTHDNYELANDEEEYEELYKDVNVRLRDVEHSEEWKEDA